MEASYHRDSQWATAGVPKERPRGFPKGADAPFGGGFGGAPQLKHPGVGCREYYRRARQAPNDRRASWPPTSSRAPITATPRQLFIDDRSIAETRGVTHNLNQPAKYAGNPIMIPLYPWEGALWLYGTVWNDTEEGRFRMWYQGQAGMAIPQMGSDIDSPWSHIGFDPSNLLYTAGYATSQDGIFWERPNLGVVEYKGSRDNNLVMLDACYVNVVKDVRDPDPARRYKSLFWQSDTPDGTRNMGDGVSVAFSPDGLRWTKHPRNPVIARSSDNHMLLGWDDLHGKYVAYARPTVHEGNKTRRIGRAVSDDFESWTDPEDVLAPDDKDPPGTELYGMPVFKYEGLYLGLLCVYHANSEEPQIRFYGDVDIQLAVSRDGIAWERAGDRKPFIPNGPPGSIDTGEIYTALAPVVMGDELWFYYSASHADHGAVGGAAYICLAKLRRDGFVSVDAGDDTGTLVTKPFRCDGGPLSINAAARGGMVGVAVLDEAGTQHEGYSRADCALFDGDSVRHNMTWRSKTSLEDLKGRDIRLKFYLRNAKLFSFAVGQA